ncbi:30S ribosomal protein S4 [candidate division WWE3 bacterium RIFCSPLOWO2_01_FULL_37_15]|uniref:Small ribosomal subunit protein uS4 n=1 Tax=candidate division WWE3 bacterium RIFCSPLOWO2_01_FULL_37_15 TaxID=1802622 RepID=A0A1F4UWE6_UNCKA|nr:MAG: 30S ribosomal protein S4 [candidate division WWE3 bacterium RIFCSPLOWO2_01_FULL_37_15]
MARYKGPKCRLCRREGVKLYLKGARCESEKCAISKRHQAPGQHGTSRKRLSEYGVQMREKQKAKRIYGILEKQFKLYVDQALKTKGVTGETLMQKLESRLDNVVYRSGFAVSRSQARQFIRNGLFLVNGEVKKVPSEQITSGDVVKPVDFGKIHLREGFVLPDWLEANVKDRYIKYSKLPTLENLGENLNIQLIIEFYSR